MLGFFALAACRGGDPSVSFAVFGDPEEFAAYQALVDAFHQASPQIQVELRHIPSQAEYRQRLATEFSAGRPPDVMLLNYRRFAQFAEQGVLEPLEARLERSEVLEEGQFFPIAIDSFRYAGQLWCIPQNISSLVVYYNKDLFDAANLPYPTAGWDRGEFLAAARALTQDLDADGRVDQYGLGVAPNLFRLAPFLWQDNAPLVDDPDHPTRLALDHPKSLATFHWFADLQLVENVVPDAVSESVEPSESRFLNGRLGMFLNSRRGVPTYRTIEAFDWDVAPLPGHERQAGILHSDGYCLSEKATQKDGAWLFIEYANSVVGQQIVVKSGRTVPSLRAVANSELFLQSDLPPENNRVFVDTVPILRQVPIMPGWAGVEESSSKEIERAFYGLATVEEAAVHAVSVTLPFFQED